MADTRKVVRVFLASPGDLGDERRVAKSVVDEFNSLYADAFGFHVELVGWEVTVSVYGRPQEVINRDLARCELFVGMLWKRWGTPPDKIGVFTSGFEEEFETSINRRREDGRPEISLFFKKVDDDLLRDPGDQLRRVQSFKANIIDNKEILFEEFGDTREFEAKFRRRITRYVLDLRQLEEMQRLESSTSGGASSEIAEHGPLAKSGLLSKEGVAFLRQLIGGASESDEISPVDIARFRLLASIMRRDGNDEFSLGAHDANIIFLNKDILSLGDREKFGMLHCGVENISHQNYPLWHWLVENGTNSLNIMPVLSLFGPMQRRIGAIKIMRFLSLPLPKNGSFERHQFIDSWLSDEATTGLKKEALQYLGEFGSQADVPAIQLELDKSDYQTSSAASDAIIRIALQHSISDGLQALYDLQPLSVSPYLLNDLFERVASIGTDVLRRGIGHRCTDVRRKVVCLLRERGAVSPELAAVLVQDSDARIRLEGIFAMADAGSAPTDEKAKSILMKTKPTLGAISLLGGDKSEEDCYFKYRLNKYESMPIDELAKDAEDEDFHKFDARMVLARRQFHKRAKWIRGLIDDRFTSHFDAGLKQMEVRWGSVASELVGKWEPLSDHIRKQLTRQALNVLSGKGEIQDLGRVREILSSGFIEGTAEDLKFLGRCGEWCDVQLIADVVKKGGFGSGLLGIRGFDLNEIGAKAILSIAKGRLSEVLRMSLPPRLLKHILRLASDMAIRSEGEDALFELLSSEADEVRKAAAFALVRVFPKAKLLALLDAYQKRDYRYYNVIHWLDFGASLPSDRARRALRRVEMID